MNSLEYLQATKKIRCVTYKDEFSSMKSSINDLMISVQNRVVGCGSSVFGASKTGDIVLITANNEKEKYFVIGVLTKSLEDCNLWHDAGGFAWKYNFEYIPLTNIIHITDKFTQKMAIICARHAVDYKYMLHSRFCGIRYKPALIDLFIEESLSRELAA